MDVCWGILQCLLLRDRELVIRRIQREWRCRDAFICLSVRSGFDLLLGSVDWPAGSEIIMSGLTIPDMSRIVERHNYVPVGVDLDPATLAPSAAEIESRITPATRAIVVAHLFGGLVDLEPIAKVARRYNLLLIEDCAQAYVGARDEGDPRADISMFSFGPIKTNTSLAGAVFRVRNPETLNLLNHQHAKWPMQRRYSYFQRLIKYWFIHKISSRWGAALMKKYFALRGRDHDEFVAHAARGFAGSDFFGRIRQRPSAPLLKMMLSKFQDFNPATISERQRRAMDMLEKLGNHVFVPGGDMLRPTFWVMTILVENPEPLVRMLWEHGFDATHRSSLKTVGTRPLPQCQYILDHLVFLPFDAHIPDRELERMCRLIVDSGVEAPRELPSRSWAKTRA